MAACSSQQARPMTVWWNHMLCQHTVVFRRTCFLWIPTNKRELPKQVIQAAWVRPPQVQRINYEIDFHQSACFISNDDKLL